MLMTCIHHYGIIQNIFTALKIPCSTYSFLLPSQPLATTDLFTVSIVLPFPDRHIVGIVQYVTFSDWLFSHSNIQYI